MKFEEFRSRIKELTKDSTKVSVINEYSVAIYIRIDRLLIKAIHSINEGHLEFKYEYDTRLYKPVAGIQLQYLYEVSLLKLDDIEILVFKETQNGYKWITRIYSNGGCEVFESVMDST